MSEQESTVLPAKYYKGVEVPPYFSTEWLDRGIKERIQLRSDDIWIVVFPKAGCTWTSQIVRLLLNKGKSVQKTLSEDVPWVEAFNPDSTAKFAMYMEVNDFPSPRAFKSHFSYEMMPCGIPNETPGRYIYVARNPKDIVVSYFHQRNAMNMYPRQQWSELIDNWLSGKVEYGNYFEHVRSWWAHKDDPNVLFLKYEDMMRDVSSAITKIAKFLEVDASDELVKDIAAKSTFKVMKDDPTANYSWTEAIRRPNQPPFLRKGVVGDWKNYFTPDQAARMDALYEQHLKGTGLEFDFS